ncbi:MAG: cupin domain-containing protein [Actinomycetota bacterium]|nr:cupin domain-containing protein [Actinomycetota bacterium]
MAAHVTKHEGGPVPSPEEIEAAMRSDGLSPRRWANDPGDTYDWHEHGYHKVLYCLDGSIVFHTRTDGDLELRPGDRLDVEPSTAHAATVGSGGVQCVEAPR